MTEHGERASRNRRGSASVMALMVILVIGGLTVAFLQVGVSFNRSQSSRLEDERAFYLAEAGLQECLAALRGGGTGRVGTQALPARLGAGCFWVEVSDLGNDVLRARSSAMVGGGRVALERVIFHTFGPPFTTGVFSNQSLVIESNTLIDSYDSSLGDYASQDAATAATGADAGAVVQSNGQLEISSAAQIFGDVHCGPEFDVTLQSSGTVSGSMEPSPEEINLEPVVAPAIPIGAGLTVDTAGSLILPPGDHGLAHLEVRQGTLEVRGPARLVVGDWTLRSNTEMVLDTSGGAIELFISGSGVLASNSALVTTDESALSASIYLVGGPGQVLELSSNSEFHGTILAPEGQVIVNSNFEIFGAVAAEQLEIDANSKIHFDEALLASATQPEQFLPASWNRAEFPVRELLVNRGDPFRLLGVQPGDLPTPSEAHEPTP